MDFTRIKSVTDHRICTITLSRPEMDNALDDLMVSELMSAFQSANRDPNVKVILLNAEGDSFCSGADLSYLQKISKFDFIQNQEDSNSLMRLFLQIYTGRKPVIAVVQGGALAGGCGLATVCDIVIASKETAMFGYTEAHIGLVPAIVLFFLIRRVGEGKAREMTLRGHVMTADEAYRSGLVNVIAPETEIAATSRRMAEEIVKNCSSSSLGLIKELFSRIHGMSVSDALSYAANLNALTRMTDDCKKGIEAFLRKEPIQW
jgi:methylglutaconyl-CoA hydratase